MPRSELVPTTASALAARLPFAALALALALLGAGAGGCSSDGEGTPQTGDAGVDPSGDGGSNGGGGDDGGAGEDAGPRPPPVFLDPSVYADYVTIDAALPFGVTAVHAADRRVLGSRWGRHGGPMVTVGAYTSSDGPTVVTWTLGATPTAPAAMTERSIALASDLPTPRFYGADGVVDLPFGPASLLSYSGGGVAFAGEALLYDATYGAVTSRAHVNGFYSGVGLVDGAAHLLVYSGLSPLSTTTSATDDCGLYAATVCDGVLAAGAPCAPSWKLFGWSGASGPVAVDTRGDVFVGASLASGATSDAIYGITKAQITPGTSTTAALVAGVDSLGTASLAAVAPEGDAPGWVFGLGYDTESPIYAASFVARGDALEGAVVVDAAIRRASGVSGVSVFTDDEGDLWLAVTRGSSGGAYLELRRTTP